MNKHKFKINREILNKKSKSIKNKDKNNNRFDNFMNHDKKFILKIVLYSFNLKVNT